MRDCIESIKFRGYKIKIYQDDNSSESPDDWGDDSLFLVGYHRDFTVDRSTKTSGGIPPGLAQDITRGGKYEDGIENYEAARYCKEYHIFGLEAYIHSGVSLALSQEGSFVDREWDVSQLGLVFVSKKEWKTREKAREAARGLIKTWNMYLSGEVYGYLIENTFGEESGGCWGFYGSDYKASGLIDNARGEINEAKKQDKELARIAAGGQA